MKESGLVDGVVFNSGDDGVLIREDRSVLSYNVKQMNSAGLNCLSDVCVGCICINNLNITATCEP